VHSYTYKLCPVRVYTFMHTRTFVHSPTSFSYVIPTLCTKPLTRVAVSQRLEETRCVACVLYVCSRMFIHILLRINTYFNTYQTLSHRNEMHRIKNSPLPLVVSLVNDVMWKVGVRCMNAGVCVWYFLTCDTLYAHTYIYIHTQVLGSKLTATVSLATQAAMTGFISNVPGPQLGLTVCGECVCVCGV
jgi:hypothetical protein